MGTQVMAEINSPLIHRSNHHGIIDSPTCMGWFGVGYRSTAFWLLVEDTIRQRLSKQHQPILGDFSHVEVQESEIRQTAETLQPVVGDMRVFQMQPSESRQANEIVHPFISDLRVLKLYLYKAC